MQEHRRKRGNVRNYNAKVLRVSSHREFASRRVSAFVDPKKDEFWFEIGKDATLLPP